MTSRKPPCRLTGDESNQPERFSLNRFTDQDGLPINYQVTGSGYSSVVLDAGFRAGADAWARVAADLDDIAKLLVLDRTQPTEAQVDSVSVHGSRMVDQLEEIFQSEGLLHSLILVGWGLGTYIAHAYASSHPARVGGLVLIDPVPPAVVQRMSAQSRVAERDRSQYSSELIAEVDFVLQNLGPDALAFNPPAMSPSIPQVHILRGELPDSTDAPGKRWVELQRENLNACANVREVIAGRSGANIPDNRPDVIVDAVRDMIARSTVPER